MPPRTERTGREGERARRSSLCKRVWSQPNASSDIAYRLADCTAINRGPSRNASLSVEHRVTSPNYIVAIFSQLYRRARKERYSLSYTRFQGSVGSHPTGGDKERIDFFAHSSCTPNILSLSLTRSAYPWHFRFIFLIELSRLPLVSNCRERERVAKI